MPSKSESQRKLFGLAYSVKKGDKPRGEVSKKVLDIVDRLSLSQIKDFMVKEDSSLRSAVLESMNADFYNTKYSDGREVSFTKPERLFAVIKPKFTHLVPDVLEMLEEAGFELDRIKPKTLSEAEAKELYEPHKKESFFKSLVEYMTSDISVAITLKHKCRDLKTAMEKLSAVKDSVRKKWGESEKLNVMHSTDDPERLEKETKIYFF